MIGLIANPEKTIEALCDADYNLNKKGRKFITLEDMEEIFQLCEVS